MSSDVYRRCASIVVFRKQQDGYQVLFVHKPRKNDAWQIPQGGCEQGETLEETALREVGEEAGLKPEILGISTEVYQYDFPKSYRRFRPDNVCGQCISYVFATVSPDAMVQVDDEEIDDFVWVSPKEFSRYIKRRAYLRLVHRLYEEGVERLSE